MKHRLIAILFLSSIAFGQEEAEAPSDIENSAAAEDTVESETPSDLPSDGSESNEMGENPEGAPVTVNRVLPDPNQRRIQDVIEHLALYGRDQEVIKFSDEEESISGLYLPENTGKPQGGILILHDVEQHAHWPTTVAPLREYLPDYGWNTLSLFFTKTLRKPLPEIPQSEPEPLSATEDDAENNTTPIPEEAAEEPTEASDELTSLEEPLTEDSPIDENFADTDAIQDSELANIAEDFIPNEERSASVNETEPEEDATPIGEAFLNVMTERVEGGLRQLNTLGQFNLVVIAHGRSANWAVNTLKQRFEANPGAKGYALILVNAVQSDFPEYPLNDHLADFAIPILDLYTEGNDTYERLAKERKDAVVRKQKAQYMQIRLPAMDYLIKAKHQVIARRVRGWLKTNAAGEEVEVRVRGS